MSSTRSDAQTKMILRVADRIENEPGMYDQSTWCSPTMGRPAMVTNDLKIAEPFDCGQVACIAGWAMLENWVDEFDQIRARAGENKVVTREMLLPRPIVSDDPSHFLHHGRKVLGLGEIEAELLFDEDWKPAGWERDDDDIAVAKKTAQALRDLANGDSIQDITWVWTPDDDGPENDDHLSDGS